MDIHDDSLFTAETALERRIMADPCWREGMAWGEPRSGHPEGKVVLHIADVLRNLDQQDLPAEQRQTLRLVALLHDAFKREVDPDRPRTGENHHAMRARRFAERYIDDPALLDLIELHDEAFNSWRVGSRRGNWQRAETRARALVRRLGASLPLYLHFFDADISTAGKTSQPLEWFKVLVEEPGHAPVMNRKDTPIRQARPANPERLAETRERRSRRPVLPTAVARPH